MPLAQSERAQAAINKIATISKGPAIIDAVSTGWMHVSPDFHDVDDELRCRFYQGLIIVKPWPACVRTRRITPLFLEVVHEV